MRSSFKLPPQNYELDDQSEDINLQQQIQSIIKDLIPTYYQYRSHLMDILKQTNPSAQVVDRLQLPPTIMEDRMRKYGVQPSDDSENIPSLKFQSKQQRRKKITQQIIEKRRKSIAQEKELERRYENEEMNKFRRIKEEDNSIIFVDESSLLQTKAQQYRGSSMYIPTSQTSERNYPSQKHGKQSHHFQIPQMDREESIISQKSMKIDKKGKTSIVNLIKERNQQMQTSEININDESMYRSSPFKSSHNHLQPRNPTGLRKMSNSMMEEQKLFSKSKKDVPKVQFASDVEITSNAQRAEQFFRDEPMTFEKRKTFFDEHTSNESKIKAMLRMSKKPESPVNISLSQNKFMTSQHQKLSLQRSKAQELKKMVDNVLQESDQSFLQENVQEEKQSLEDKFLNSIRHMLSELVNLEMFAETYKYKLKNRQYEILRKIYSLAGIQGDKYDRILISILQKGIQRLLESQQKSKIESVFQNFFHKKSSLNFEEFSQIFKPRINEQQYRLFHMKSKEDDLIIKTTENIKRFFLLLIEIDYFEKKVRKLIKMNSGFNAILKTKINDQEQQQNLSLSNIQQFIFQTQNNRANNHKIGLYFEERFPSMKAEQFFQWAYSAK